MAKNIRECLLEQAGKFPALLTEAVYSAERASQNDKVEKWCKES